MQPELSRYQPNLEDYLSGPATNIDTHHMALVKDGQVTEYQGSSPAHVAEAKQMSEIVGLYLNSAMGKGFVDYVERTGKEFVDIKGVGSADLGEGVVAAMIQTDLEGVLVSNYDGIPFADRVSEMTKMYEPFGVDMLSMVKYVVTHELAHAAGHLTEEGAEGYIKDFFTDQATITQGAESQEYRALASIAQKREAEAKEARK